MQFEFDGELFPWESNPSIVFVALAQDDADAINDAVSLFGGFGSVKVNVRIGGTAWSTSLFPSKELETFVLPIKKAVREAEGLEIGGIAAVEIELVNI